MKKIILIVVYLFTFKAFAYSPFWLGVGNTTHNFLTAQRDTKGATKVVEFAPTILLGMTIPFLYSGMFLSPGIGFSKFITEDKTSKSEFILQYHLSQTIFSSIQLHYGFSNYLTRIGGDGSDVSLNNGTGTSTFYAPKETKTSYTASLDLAPEFVINSQFAVKLQFSLMRFLSSERRRVSHLLTGTYFF
ncbi:MAG: hypothetical protein KBD76_07095 [Bacteriovorax sp.]|nr:hypothetical protein [Bacteriovorax sp.]